MASPASDILVLGGGPAGCLAGLRLAGLGHRVTLATAARSTSRTEGLSARAREVLARYGCRHALAALGPEAVRRSHWNGDASEHNRETLVERSAFDAGLLADAAAGGVSVVRVDRPRIATAGAGWRLAGRGPNGALIELDGEVLIEARGRRAPRGGAALRGPEVTALSRSYRGLPRRPMTAIAAFADGWAWYASSGDGCGCLQIFLASDDLRLAKRAGLSERFAACLEGLPEAAAWLGDGRPAGALTVRAAGPVLSRDLIGRNRIRLGDAAAAIDPLSGHGIFEALGSALAGSAVINTLLRRPENRDLAAQFYRERTELGFLRLCRTGRAFYAGEARWPERPFWQQRAAWPDDQPAHAPATAARPRIELRPVVEQDLIMAHPVVVTADQPRGTFQVDGVPLVHLIDLLRPGRDAGAALATELAEALHAKSSQVETALDWLSYRGLLTVSQRQATISPVLQDKRRD